MTRMPPYRRKEWPCGCVSNNVYLAPCAEHLGSVSTATNLRATDPRLNVVHAPSRVTLQFMNSQGRPGVMSALLSRESLEKVLALMSELDETPDPEES